MGLCSVHHDSIVGEIAFLYFFFISQKFSGINVFVFSLAKSAKLEQGTDFFFPSEVQTETSETPTKPLGALCPCTRSLVSAIQQ